MTLGAGAAGFTLIETVVSLPIAAVVLIALQACFL
jgi:prepilin-type N-terminal cleavage/methylation domain-containing protein